MISLILDDRTLLELPEVIAMATDMDLKDLRDFALARGALGATAIPAGDIVFDERAALKCRYGCPAYGRYLTCPPFTPEPREFKRALRRYSWALLLECETSELNRLVVEVEKEAMRTGFYMALGLKGHPCRLCEECVPQGEPCRDPANARPSMSGLGINVFETLRKAGVERRLSRGEEDSPSWGMVLVD